MRPELRWELRPAPSGLPIVLIGSLGSDRRMWDPQIERLGARHPIVLVDHPGHGGEPALDEASGVDDLADAVVGAADSAGIDRFHVAGLSLGGMVGMALAVRHPNRIERLAVLCSSAHLPPEQAWLDRADLVRQRGMGAVAEAVVERWFTPKFRSDHPATVTWAVDMVAAVDPVGYARCCEAIAAMDLRSELPRITKPTLVVAGADDPATPPDHARTIVSGIESAVLRLVGPAAHLANVEQSAVVTGLLVEHFAGQTVPDGEEDRSDSDG